MEYVPPEEITVNYKLAPGDKLIYCPYNRSHQVLEFKAATHLGVCRQAYVNSSNYKGIAQAEKIVKCRWRPNKHHLPGSQISAHEKSCEGNNENLWDKFEALEAQQPTSSKKDGKTYGEKATGCSYPNEPNDDDEWDNV